MNRTRPTGGRETGLAEALEVDLGAIARLDGDRVRQRDERGRARVEARPLTHTRARARRCRAVPEPNNRPREGRVRRDGRERGRGTFEVVLDVDGVYVRGDFLP